MLFCSSRTIDRWVERFRDDGEEAVAGHKPGRSFRLAAGWAAVAWVTSLPPRCFGFHRSRPADAGPEDPWLHDLGAGASGRR